jgi:hypothetical protein
MKLEFDVPDKYGTEFKDYMQAIFNQVLETLEQSEWPQRGDEYYYIDADGVVEPESWDDSFDDRSVLKFGNCFRTKKEAEFKAEQLKVLHELEELADDDQEWDGDHRHFVIKYKHDVNKLSIEYWITDQHCQFYFKSMQSAQAAINKIGEERLKKYYFCVPENK